MICRKVLQKIFSVQNVDTHKIITVLWLKFKLKNKKLVKRKIRKKQEEFENTVLGLSEKEFILYFDHAMGGGTETYFRNQLRNLPKGCQIIRVQYLINKKSYKISTCTGLKEISVKCANLAELFCILDKFLFEKIVINNIVSYPKVREIFDYIECKNSCVTLKLHDFYPICPSWTLLNYEQKYCDIGNSDKTCADCYKKFEMPCDEVKKDFSILKWRKMWGNFIYSCVNEIEIFSPSSCRIFLKAYPFAKDKIKLIPHTIKSFPKYNVAILGNLAVNKGAKIIKELVKYLSYNNINDYHFVLIGKNPRNIKSENLTVLGEYKRDNLFNILKINNIDAIFIPSIWPETFSYTTAEAIMSGYPVMCFDMGGQADQVCRYSKGKILSSFEPETIEKEMGCFLKNMKGVANETCTKISNKGQSSYGL